MQLELAQISLSDNAVGVNVQRVLDVIERRANGTELIVFPEATLSGFPGREEISAVAETIGGPSLCTVREAARRADVAVAVGLMERDGDCFYNTTVLIDNKGDIALRYRKTHLWPTEVGTVVPGDRFEVCQLNDVKVGLLICYDIEFPETARAMALLGVELLIVTNGNMDPFGPVHRRAIVARAMENQIFAALTNRVGSCEDQLTFPGQSALIDPFGEVLCEAGASETVLRATLDMSRLETSRQHYRYMDDTRIALNLDTGSDVGGRRFLTIPAR